jgi:hypothetical protein
MSEWAGVGRGRPEAGVGVAGLVGVAEAAGCRETLGGPGPVRQWGWPTFWTDRALPTAGWRTDGRSPSSCPFHFLALPSRAVASTSAPLHHVHLTYPPTGILYRL